MKKSVVSKMDSDNNGKDQLEKETRMSRKQKKIEDAEVESHQEAESNEPIPTSHDTPKSRKEKYAKDEEERPQKRSKLKYSLIILGSLFILGLIGYTIILYGGKLIVTEQQLMVSTPTTIETEDGEVVWELFEHYRKPVHLKDMPDYVPQAFVATEDKRFYSHSGVDMKSVFRALYKDILAGSKVEGGSTITQQLAKNLYLTNEKTWMRKTKEVMVALYLEREYSKDEILQMYLNVIYFGQGQYGIEAASNKFFDKSVGDLNVNEAALLAGIVNAPNAYSPIDVPEKALSRRNLVLDRMYDAEIISEKEMNAEKEKDLTLNITERKVNPAYVSYVDRVIKEAESKYGITLEMLKNNNYQIITKINPKMQEVAYYQFENDHYFPGANKETINGAFVMMEEASGGIAAMVGGRNFQMGDNNLSFQMKKQPASTLKPLAVYGPALETGNYNAYSTLPDQQIPLGGDGKIYRNVDNIYDGQVSFYDALVRSKNSSAAWLLDDMGIETSMKYLNKMNLDIDDKKDGLGIALGATSTGMSPLDLVERYRAFDHGGEMIQGYAIEEIRNHEGGTIHQVKKETKKIFSEQTAWTMTEMLRGVVERGTGSSGQYPKQLAGKTGTSTDDNDKAKDLWFVGYTPDYVTALWMGYDQITDTDYLTGGSSSPTELTKSILTEINWDVSLADRFEKPENVQALEEPVDLPNSIKLSGSYQFGGLKLVKGKLEWTSFDDSRVIYQVHRVKKDGEDEVIAEVTGDNEYVIDEFLLFNNDEFYVVPYDPLGERAGEPSNKVQISI